VTRVIEASNKDTQDIVQWKCLGMVYAIWEDEMHSQNQFIYLSNGGKAVFVTTSSVRNLGHRVGTRPKKGAE
jgi:hypothetical protein